MILETAWFCNYVNVRDMTGTCGNYVLVTLLEERFENVYRRGAAKLSIPGGTHPPMYERVTDPRCEMSDIRYQIS